MIDATELTYLPGMEPGSPEWWLKRLLARLEDRQWPFRKYERYYDGDQPLALWSNKLRDRFGERFGSEEFSSNFMSLVVDRTRERFEVQGFRFTDKKGDADLWDIWQSNNLDAGSQIAHTEALIKGIAYTLVEPALDNGKPIITIEDPCDTIVETGPKGQRLAGLKRWIDDEGYVIAYVYLPDYVFTFRSDQSVTGTIDSTWLAQAKFSRYDIPGEDWPLVNRLRVVPLVALPYRPRLRKFGQSELDPVIPNQNAIDFYKASAIVAALYVAYPQRYVLNLDAETDPDTGAELEPFQSGMASLWRVPPPDPNDPNPPIVSFGQFNPGSLEPYMTAIGTEVGHISAISGIPRYLILVGDSSSIPPSAEQTKTSEAALTSKVGNASIHLGDGWEETMRVALTAMGDSRANIRTAETIWRDPETRNEAVRTDSIIKQFTSGLITVETAQEMLGYSPEQIERMREERLAAQPVPVVTPAPTGPQMTRTFSRDGAGNPQITRQVG